MALSLKSIHLHKVALLALASNAVLKLWKWQRNERNPTGNV
jgi:hypothetical protein